MRHGKAGRKLKRTASHRRATLGALATALLRHKRIVTTVAKAKETRILVEKMITRARKAVALKDAPPAAGGETTAKRSERETKFLQAGGHARREVARLINDRAVVAELFTTIAEKVGARPGGYTRIVRLGQRPGDAAELAVIELVDFNVGQESQAKKSEKSAKKKSAKKPAAKKKDAGTKKSKTEQKEREAREAAAVEPATDANATESK
jgi:large subunit ribosomal protein L17